MNKEHCLVCKFHGIKSEDAVENYLYQYGSAMCIHLCYVHSLELFKSGQTQFLMKHYEHFSSHGLDPDRFFEKRVNSFNPFR